MKRSEMVEYLAYYISGEYFGEGDIETTQEHIIEADFLLSKLEGVGMLPHGNEWEPEDNVDS